MSDTRGNLVLVLHHHLPFIRHPEYEDFMEEDWLHQALVETYLPLLAMFERLRAEGLSFRATVSLTPPLIAMLDDSLLRERSERHLSRLLRLAESECHRTRDDEARHRLANYYRGHLDEMRDRYLNEYRRDVVSRYGDLQESGHLEIITCGATHGFLPLMNGHEPAMRAQIEVAVRQYRDRFGGGPRGIWLGECGYQPGVDRLLADAGIEYFFVDTHGLVNGEPRPRYGVFAPVMTEANVGVFGRDLETSHQVWSAETGYPADPVYREFYRDVGWDLELDYLRPFLGHHGFRKYTGIKYHRVTGPGCELHEKAIYDPWEAERKSGDHAGNFLFNRERQIENLAGRMDRPPTIVAPYDAELFGHWWYEGPRFLEHLIRQSQNSSVLRLATPTDVLAQSPAVQRVTPSQSSWGYKGFSEYWLNQTNDWVYRHLHNAQEQMTTLADRFAKGADPLMTRVLNQAARELLLAQSSDWAFIMKTGTVVEYAEKRCKEHVHRFLELAKMCESGAVDAERLSEWESRDNIFGNIDYLVYRSRPGETLALGVAQMPVAN